jgi:hypothetical protein
VRQGGPWLLETNLHPQRCFKKGAHTKSKEVERGIISLEDQLCVCDFVREKVIKADVGVLKEVHHMVVALGHGGRRSSGQGRRSPDGFMIGGPSGRLSRWGYLSTPTLLKAKISVRQRFCRHVAVIRWPKRYEG